MYHKNKYCSFCGALFPQPITFPHQCKVCNSVTYINPLPVAVGLIPIKNWGLLTVRRNIEPKKGELALPGGFIEVGESWQAAVAREVWEETGIKIEVEKLQLFDTLSAPDGTVLIFGLLVSENEIELPDFQANNETQELVVLENFQPLAFPLHTKVCERYFEKLYEIPH